MTPEELDSLPVIYGPGAGHDDRWRDHAACEGSPPEWWFPDEYGAQAAEARRVCASCPVRVDCLTYALAEYEVFGVWGGASERSRRLLRHRLARSPHADRPFRVSGCRCGFCREWDLLGERLVGLVAGVAVDVVDGVTGTKRSHGKAATYAAGCRCEPCREGMRESRRRGRERRESEAS